MALLDEMARQLITASVGTTAASGDWAVYKGFLPATPDKCLALFETGGFPNEGHSEATVDRPTFQLMVRGNEFGYSTARAKIGAARTTLETVHNQTLLGWRYVQVQAHQEPISLGQDENRRPRLVMNFTALRSRTS